MIGPQSSWYVKPSLVVGGDKTDRWDECYDEMIPIVDRLDDEYLADLRNERELS
jgi:hypothetical protein